MTRISASRLLAAAGFVLLSTVQLSPLTGQETDPAKIARRTAWTTSRIHGSPLPPPPYRIERVFENLQFAQPIALVAAPRENHLVLVELNGKVFSFPRGSNAKGADVKQADLMIDLHEAIEGHRRTYGIAFHPQFEKNGFIYLCYVTKEGDPKGSRVSRFRAETSAPFRIDPKSEKIILQWHCGGHNGGCLKFGPDGYLYITTGDGTSPSPPDGKNTGQDISDLLSSVLRIDVDKPGQDLPYSIPEDNPFVNLEGARPEVWAYGFRNPWKISFDPVGGGLWLGDVGWEMWEMIYRVERGGNYGWSIIEGHQKVKSEGTPGPTPILPPTIAHSHIESRSITGGLVYRGKRLKDLQGSYVYGDYVTGIVWAAGFDGNKITWKKTLVDTPLQVIAFGADRAGECYVVGYDGTIHRLEKNPSAEANKDFPVKLSQTGLFASVADHQPATGVIKYRINAEPWSDGAHAERLLAVPGKEKLGVFTAEENNVQKGNVKGEYKFPAESVLVKTLSLETAPGKFRRIETQILHRDGDTWRAYTYAWNDKQTDAELVAPEGMDRAYQVVDPDDSERKQRQTWHFASRNECIVCHTTRAGTIHGFNVRQLNRDVHRGKNKTNQLTALAADGYLDQHPPQPTPRMPNPHDQSLDLEQRARAYLHVNCAHCHRRGGGGTAVFQAMYDLPLVRTDLIGARPTQGTFNIHAPEVIAPGDPYRSVLYYRMAKLGSGRMPHTGSSVVDRQGLQLIHDWVAQLPPKVEGDARRQATEKLRLRQTSALKKLADSAAAKGAIQQLLSSTSGALRLAGQASGRSFQKDLRKQAVELAAARSPEIRDLFERFVPEEKRTQRLGTVIRPQEILSLKGDASRGRTLFLQTAGMQCKNCHRIGKQGQEVGPDLSQIGKKYDRARLLEEILQPSKTIDPKFTPYLVETTDGRVLSGLLVKKDEKQVVLRSAENKLIQLAADEIELLAPRQKSIMPELLLRDLTARQVADLLAFLSSLK